MTLSHILIPGVSGLALILSVGILKDPMSRSLDHGVAHVDAITFQDDLPRSPRPLWSPQLLSDVSSADPTLAPVEVRERAQAFVSMRGKVMALLKGQRREQSDPSRSPSISPAKAEIPPQAPGEFAPSDDGYLPDYGDFGSESIPEDNIAQRLSPAMASTPLHLRVSQGDDVIEVKLLAP